MGLRASVPPSSIEAVLMIRPPKVRPGRSRHQSPRFGEEPIPPEEDHEGTGEGVRRDDVDEGRQPSMNANPRTAPIERATRPAPEEGNRVGRKDRAVGALEASVNRGPDGPARSHFVL